MTRNLIWYALGTGPKLVPVALPNLNVGEATPQLKAYFSVSG
jgi:hypothetical protein